MKALIQRVLSAQVDVAGSTVGKINRGLLVFLGVQSGDDQAVADKMVHKLANYRVFADDDGKMNQSLIDTGGEMLIVSQFTLAASTKKGMRPSFSSAAEPAQAKELYEYCIDAAAQKVPHVASGQFGADMQVSLVNDGPVTFLLDI